MACHLRRLGRVPILGIEFFPPSKLVAEAALNDATIMNTTTHKKDILPLTADLTRAELAEALGALRFRSGSHCLISVDKDVRDYLLRALNAR